MKPNIYFSTLLYIFILLISSSYQTEVYYTKTDAILTDPNFDYHIIDTVKITSTVINPTDYEVLNNTAFRISITPDNLKRLGEWITLYSNNDPTQQVRWIPFILSSISSVPTEGGILTINGYFINNKVIFFFIGQFQTTPTNATIDSALILMPQLNDSSSIYNINSKITVGSYMFPSFLWSVKDPTISSVSLNNRLIINGSSFGPNKDWIRCNVAGYHTPSVLPIVEFTKHTGVILDISSLANEFKFAGLKLLTLTVNDPFSNISRSTTYNIPIVPIITKTTSTSSDLGGPVTISGDLFNSVNSFGFKTIKSIQIGSQSCLNPVDLFVNSGSFICQLGPISKMSNIEQFTNIPILVTIDGATSINSNIIFNYDAPSISNIYQNGSKIYFEGELLGYSSQISKTLIFVSNTTMINNSFVPSQIDIVPPETNTSSVKREWIVQLLIPNNFKSGLYNFFISNHNNQLKSKTTQLEIKPDIGEISTPQTKGDTLTILGALFGNPISIKFTNRPDIKNTSNPILIDSSTIIVNISAGSGQNIGLQLNVNGVITSKSFRYHQPTIKSVTPITTLGGVITITGSNYDINNTTVSISNSIRCSNTTIVNDTTIYCHVKLNDTDTLNVGENLNVTINVNTQIVYSSTLNITSITGGKETNILSIVLPISIFTCLFILITISIITVKYIKKQRQSKAIKKFNN
ncbi:IPT/TIG domain-containing protein [Heterostelium album PN500]|uniref:IPT/TIG domain-containing protein n=1 Tax=Heterostelium pallidum (strain ATCC 26659 / Pp 5 / PN500) TaxID=670386 RepID=D3B8J1_HETP5|nr:IPT/TIG domain-containing protein [Heterostelium album PN500]EFA82359.1 IPT/TIG domain-containing protein [Heterostelium album PN500]|eukprot:XP_020434476.1 IPT/TIG domain-containing protein [Heterostelium album PN500]